MGIGENEVSCCCLGAEIVEIVLQIYVGKDEVGIRRELRRASGAASDAKQLRKRRERRKYR